MHSKWRRAIWLGVILLPLVLYGLMRDKLEQQVIGYSVVKEDVAQTITVNGKVELSQDIFISSNIKGRVADIKVAPGESVSVGTVLFTLDSSHDHDATAKSREARILAEERFKKVSELTLAGSEQSLKRAKNSLEHAEKQYSSMLSLAEKGYVSQAQTSEALKNLTVAQSLLVNAQFQAKATRAKGSEYDLAEKSLKKARALENRLSHQSSGQVVKTQYDGVVTDSRIKRGTMILPGKTLMVVTPADKTRLLVQLDKNHLNALRMGQTVSVVTEESPNSTFNAVLADIGAANDAAQALIDLKFVAINPPENLRQNMTVLLSIETARRAGAISVPESAIRNIDTAEPWVMVADNCCARRRIIKIGSRNKDKVEVLEGLSEGDFVLLSPESEVKEGKRIRLAKLNR